MVCKGGYKLGMINGCSIMILMSPMKKSKILKIFGEMFKMLLLKGNFDEIPWNNFPNQCQCDLFNGFD